MNQHDEKHYKFGRTDPWPDYPLEDAEDDKAAWDVYIFIVCIVIGIWLLFGSPEAAADETSEARQDLIETLQRIQHEDRQRARDYEQRQFQHETTERLRRMERDAEFRSMVDRNKQRLFEHEMRQK